MQIDKTTLAMRLKKARNHANLTQDDVAGALALPRTAVVQIESGNRAISTLELAKLAPLYSRTIGSFFDETESDTEEDAMVALFRAAQVDGNDAPWRAEVSRYLEICRAGVELEHLLNRPPHIGPPSYELALPKTVMDAVDQGNHIAEQERRRLLLGDNPVADMSDLINGQNIWASGAHLPDPMSGFFLRHSSIGLFILVNYDHPRARKRFSYAHEYAHALLDRRDIATVSLATESRKLTEVRANAFAAAFLSPPSGVRAFLSARFKAGPSLIEQTVYDPATASTGEEVKASRRAAPRSQSLTYEDVAALAHHFGISYLAAMYRLKSLGIVNGVEFDELREKEPFGMQFLGLLEVRDDLDGHDDRKPDREIVSQVLHLSIEAYRRDEITTGKVRDLSKLLGIAAKDLLALAEAA